MGVGDQAFVRSQAQRAVVTKAAANHQDCQRQSKSKDRNIT